MSTVNKKKGSSSPKHSIKEHHDEITDGNNREKNLNTDEIPIEEIHTANDWEHADLGDDLRKQKFLRLMGAKKRKDECRIDSKNSSSITHNDIHSFEKKHCRSKTQNEAINLELEKQFNEGLQSKILHTHHEGLGFHGSDISTASSSNDWHHEQVKTKFVPATTTESVPSSLNEAIPKELDNTKNKSKS
ncbi:unnamed protein product [Rotaria sp. Silwood1]|nr:unnamed protein product [Rotaria sp. Silwood1]CAF1172036.1 unnamed protein product [Rotaria sp. Silwood1]CAF1176381.1 unnamed protein product [Rotaria sp. Silwood1]CAF3416339.1 unnamed protein product [Rotaria sp. Silwood1]CAF3466599.1 unnamed protein product [Rotaria sp. Silwood1]